jgi:hypothetical protein
LRIIKLGQKKIKKFPFKLTLPREWFVKNGVRAGDILEVYMSEHGELIVKLKQE